MTGRTRLCLLAVLVATVAACDTGDGTSLRDPVAPTTLPPPDTTPLSSVAIDDPSLDGAPAIDSLPIATAPPETGGFEPSGFRVFTPWGDGSAIDVRYTCDGANASPSIAWSEPPAGTAEVAISMVDTSNLSNGRPFVHWVISGLDPATERIGEAEVPPDAVQGLNFFGDVGYTGPCPDPGATNTYELTVFALNQQLELADATPAAELLDVIGAVAIESSTTSGLVTR